MELERVNLGVIPDGTGGDTPRLAWDKMNRNAGVIEEGMAGIDTVVEEVEQLKTQIEQEVTEAISTINQEIADLETALPGMVDEQINGRIPGKNRLINGSMMHWQRGLSFTVSGSGAAYTLDRFKLNWASVNCTISRLTLAGGEIDQLIWATRVAVSNFVGGTSGLNLRQSIEFVHTLAGKTATLSFWAKASVGALPLSLRALQNFGSGGSASVTATITDSNVALTTAWVRYQRVVTIPSIAGKTVGANNCLDIIFDFAANGSYDIAGVQLEEGNVATGFDYQNFNDELMRCQRFFEKSYDLTVGPGTASADGYETGSALANGFFLSSSPRFKVAKRTTPSVAVYAISGQANALGEWGTTGSFIANRTASITNQSNAGFEVRSNGTAVGGNQERYHWTADAEI